MPASPARELDDMFGECRDGDIRNEEATADPVEVLDLDQPQTASYLNELFDLAINNPLAFQILLNITLIWAVTEQGGVRLCVEQSFDAENAPEKRFPRTRNLLAYPARVKHLGHPMLVGNGRARIAGELYLDRDPEFGLVWVLSNKSGRYGYDRKLDHLIKVSDEFRSVGIFVKLSFAA